MADGAALFREARDRADWPVASDLALAVGRACSNLTLSSEALRWTQESAQAAQQASDAERECLAWGQLAAEYARHDQLSPAIDALEEVERRLSAVQAETALQGMLSSTAATYYGLGLTLPALRLYGRALELAQRGPDLGQRVTLRTNWLVVAHSHHRYLQPHDAAAAAQLVSTMESELAQLVPEVQALGAPRGHWRLAHVTASVHLDAARPEEAVPVLEGLLAADPELPPVLISSIWVSLARARLACGDEHGCRAAAEAAEVAADLPGAVPRSYDFMRRAEIAELKGDLALALAHYKDYHHRTRQVLVTAIEARLENFVAHLSQQDALIENNSLRARNADLAEGVQKLGQLATSDPLTGLLNRRGFDEASSRLSGVTGGVVVALFDIDHFKLVNDSHGHAVGDAVLKEVAALLASGMRPPDRLARHGGEEFALLLPNVAMDDADGILERMRERVAAHDWSARVPGLAVTLSGGAVQLGGAESVDAALIRADQLLYQAKQAGRNRIVTLLES